MKSFIVAALSIACVLALGNAAPAPSSSSSVKVQFEPMFDNLAQSVQNQDMAGAMDTLKQISQQSSQAASQATDTRDKKIYQGVKTQVDSALSQVESGNGGLGDTKSLGNSASLALREVGGWGLGTAMGVAQALGEGAGGVVSGAERGLQSGLEDGDILKALVNGATGAASEGANGLVEGAGEGFVSGLGALLNHGGSKSG